MIFVSHRVEQGQVMTSMGADELLAILTHDPGRYIYRGQDGGWWLTRSRDEIDRDAVRSLLQMGVIQSCYSDCPSEAYHVGRTIDVPRTLEARRAHGRKAPLIYTDQQTPGA